MKWVATQLAVLIILHVVFHWCHAGITSINCSGRLWVEPAAVFQMGTNISVYCRASGKNCQPRMLYLHTNGVAERFLLSRVNRTTARHRFQNFLAPRASMYCTAKCPGRPGETLVCGQDITSGYPPDAPQALTCVLHERSGPMSCSWMAGRHTHMATEYVVHVQSLETGEEQRYPASGSLNITPEELPAGREFRVWVRAANALGTEESERLHVHLDDIVIPSASIISKAETLNATMPQTIIHWESDTALEKLTCQVRYAATTNRTWRVKEFDTNFTYAQQAEFFLEPGVNYVFQVRCREAGSRHWQPWSAPFYHKTPDTAPQVTQKSLQRGARDSDSGPLVPSILKVSALRSSRVQPQPRPLYPRLEHPASPQYLYVPTEFRVLAPKLVAAWESCPAALCTKSACTGSCICRATHPETTGFRCTQSGNSPRKRPPGDGLWTGRGTLTGQLGLRPPSQPTFPFCLGSVPLAGGSGIPGTQCLVRIIFLSSDGKQDAGLLPGMVFFAVTLSILSLIGIFNRALRTRIKRKILLLLPGWLHDQVPNVGNSNAVKMLQEKDGFVNSSTSEQVPYVDPVVTEIKEVFHPEGRKPAGGRKDRNTGTQDMKAPLFVRSPEVYIPNLSTGYKPQISSFLPEGNHLNSSGETDPSAPKPAADPFDPGKNARVRKYPRFAFPGASVSSLSSTLILEELSLILTQGDSGPPDMPNSAAGRSAMLLEDDLPSDTIPEQTVLPDDFVACLGIVNKELPSINAYFPQNILEDHFNRISLLEKQSA
nr:interleukin-23 receptor [Cavia porcellus]